jgi:hypothetical protein
MTSQPQDKLSQPDDILGQLTAAGVAIWLDDINRERLTTGNLEGLVRDMHVSGVTSNPTIFAHAVSSGHAYDAQLADLAVRGVQIDEAARAITTYDIRWGCDVLRHVYDATDGVDGRVSIEVDPRPGPCGGPSTGPTCSSRSRPPSRGYPRSPSASRRGSAST